jgi:hypothetical protein
MTLKLIEQMSDAVDLANHLYNTANDSENNNEKRNNLRYLGQCLKSMKEHIDDSRERFKDTKECRC